MTHRFFLLFAAAGLSTLAPSAGHAEPLPLRIHKEVRDKLGLSRDRDHDRGRYRDQGGYHRRSYPRSYYEPYPYYQPAITVYREPEIYVERRVEVERIPAYNLEQRVQIALAEEGHYRGPIDGIIGPATRAAIRRFQIEEDLEVTGRIDRDLLDELDLL